LRRSNTNRNYFYLKNQEAQYVCFIFPNPNKLTGELGYENYTVAGMVWPHHIENPSFNSTGAGKERSVKQNKHHGTLDYFGI